MDDATKNELATLHPAAMGYLFARLDETVPEAVEAALEETRRWIAAGGVDAIVGVAKVLRDVDKALRDVERPWRFRGWPRRSS